MKKALVCITSYCVIVFCCFLLFGCEAGTPPRGKFELTMIYPDGTRKAFTGVSVNRDNVSGEWSYVKRDGESIKTYRFKGAAECRPVLDLTEVPAVASGTLAEAMPEVKNGN